jgi:hypothetical protein
MPSSSLQIAVRVKEDLYEMIRSAADAEGRSMSNYVDQVLRRMFVPDASGNLKLKPGVLKGSTHAGRQVDIEEAIARSRKSKSVAKRK